MQPESSCSPETIHKHAEMYKHQPESIMAANECECNLFFWMRRFIIVCLISSYIQASRLTHFYWICLDSRVECLPIKKLPLNMPPHWGIKKKKKEISIKSLFTGRVAVVWTNIDTGTQHCTDLFVSLCSVIIFFTYFFFSIFYYLFSEVMVTETGFGRGV